MVCKKLHLAIINLNLTKNEKINYGFNYYPVISTETITSTK